MSRYALYSKDVPRLSQRKTRVRPPSPTPSLSMSKGIQKLERYKIDHKTGCWIWLLSTRRGYGQVSINGHIKGAHRVYFEAANGQIPKGMMLVHLCRNRRCVNPAHLEIVTNRENVRRGKSTKLTKEAAEEIKTSTLRVAVLAQKFNVSIAAIVSVQRGCNWSDVEPKQVSVA